MFHISGGVLSSFFWGGGGDYEIDFLPVGNTG